MQNTSYKTNGTVVKWLIRQTIRGNIPKKFKVSLISDFNPTISETFSAILCIWSWQQERRI